MTRQATIFKDEEEGSGNGGSVTKKKNRVTLSRDDYRKNLKIAYEEGIKDAARKNTKQITDKESIKDEKLEGKEEAFHKDAEKKEETRQKLDSITKRQDIEMLRAKSVFPFSLFPDTLIIDTTKISISRKQLFETEFITTIPLKDLGDVQVQTVLFLGTLYITYMPQSNSPGMIQPIVERVHNLKRKDAIRAKNILKGALVAKSEEIDIANLTPDEIVEVLTKFGQSSGVI